MLKKGSFFKVSALVMVVLLFVIGYLYFKKSKINADSILATSSTIVLSDKTDWDQGTLTNIDSTTSAGSIKMNEKGSGKIDLYSIYLEDNSRLTSTVQDNAVNFLTRWVGGYYGANAWPVQSPPGPAEITFDLGSNYRIQGLSISESCSSMFGQPSPWSGDIFCANQAPNPTDKTSNIYTSLNGVDFTLVRQMSGFPVTDYYPFTTPPMIRYLKISGEYLGFNQANSNFYGWNQFGIRQTHPLTKHITGATQIDGGENFWSWESFTPAESVTGTTSVSYRYRSSPDGATWTSWVSGIGLVTSRVGDTKYRYLQVEASLDNTDGATTPSIDQYSIGYHTEIKPVAPSAQTAVIQ